MKRIVTLLVALPASAPALAQDLLDPAVRDLLHEELSGELAKEHVIAITRHHRIQGSRGYRDAAHYVLAQLREYGFDEEHAWIESFPSDGKIHYQTWQSPSGWDIDSGELRMLEPFEERIVGYPEIAMSVITYSNSGDVTAELVWVGAGTSAEDYEGKDVAGKWVLATGYGGSVHRLAVLEHGAAGVVCYLDDERAAEHPDMLQYTGMWPKTDELERTTFGFNLSNRQGEKLRGLLEKGERVVLRGKVEGTGLEPFFMDVVVATIDGETLPDQEMLFCAHLDHPKESANDNASGSAAILDIARALRKLVDEGRLPRPRRTFRFLWVPEWYGTMAYVDAHPEMEGYAFDMQERSPMVLAAVNMDMVGEDQELLHSALLVTRTPGSVPSPLDDVMEDMTRMVAALDIRTPRGGRSTFNYRITPFSGGSDHMMLLDRGIPAVMMSHAPDYTHHTSEDTPDKVDPVELERCELIAAGALWYLANLTESQAIDLAWLVSANSARRIAELGRSVRLLLQSAKTEEEVREAWQSGEAALGAIGYQQEFTLSAVDQYVPPDQRPRVSREHGILRHRQSEQVAALRAQLTDIASSAMGEDEAASTDRALGLLAHGIPVRLTRGPIAFDLPERALPAERAAWYASPDFPFSGDERFVINTWLNCGRDEEDSGGGLDFVWRQLQAELGPTRIEDLRRYVDDLVDVGVLRLRKPGVWSYR